MARHLGHEVDLADDATQRDVFRKQLAAAAADTSSRVLTLTVPIEDILSGYDPPTDDQIKIDW